MPVFNVTRRSAFSEEQSPRLHDAQQVIARENGFRKWTDLKAHIDRICVEQQATLEGRPSALDGADRTLHIRCGQDIMHDLALAGFNGDFLSFADIYTEGPVPRTQSLEEFVRIRADYLEQSYPKTFEDLYGSYRDLERARDYAVANIWMEHDSHDQLILARLLYFFSEVSARPPRLRMINVTHFPGVERFVGLGQLPPQALRILWDDFEDVTETHLLLGKRAWQAITSPDPETVSGNREDGHAGLADDGAGAGTPRPPVTFGRERPEHDGTTDAEDPIGQGRHDSSTTVGLVQRPIRGAAVYGRHQLLENYRRLIQCRQTCG